MKAGGITVVATYIFWIYHEEEEGQWDWSGNRDLRAFIQLCDNHGLYSYPRIGPWAHGEVRNGGFPDWLLHKCGAKNVRRDSEPYLSEVRRLYAEISRQIAGLRWRDGGREIGEKNQCRVAADKGSGPGRTTQAGPGTSGAPAGRCRL